MGGAESGQLQRRPSLNPGAGMSDDDVAAEMRRIQKEHEMEREALQEAELYSRQKQQDRLRRQLAERRQKRLKQLEKEKEADKGQLDIDVDDNQAAAAATKTEEEKG